MKKIISLIVCLFISFNVFGQWKSEKAQSFYERRIFTESKEEYTWSPGYTDSVSEITFLFNGKYVDRSWLRIIIHNNNEKIAFQAKKAPSYYTVEIKFDDEEYKKYKFRHGMPDELDPKHQRLFTIDYDDPQFKEIMTKLFECKSALVRVYDTNKKPLVYTFNIAFLHEKLSLEDFEF